MADALNQDTNAQIDELCRKISVAHTLDAEIQAELRGHMEDQLLAYLSDQESLTENEAFALVREHFGDPARLKALLQDVHIIATHVSLARRLAAIVAVHLVYTCFTAITFMIAWSLMIRSVITGSEQRLETFVYPVTAAMVLIVATSAFWAVLAYWDRRIQSGARPWFQRERGITILLFLGALVLLHSMIPIPMSMYDKGLMPLPAPVAVNAIGIAVVLISVVIHAIIWLWWCDRPPRRLRTVTYAALAWLAISVFPLQTTKYIQLEIYAYDPAIQNVDSTERIILWEEPLDELLAVWSLRTGFTTGCPPVQNLVLSLFACIFLVALAKFIYVRLSGRVPPARLPDAMP